MVTAFDYDPRRPSDLTFRVIGVCTVIVAVLAAGTAIAKSQGKLSNLVSVTAELIDVGDGLPARSDVKFRGVLVGSVTGVTPARLDEPNIVHIHLNPDAARTIPNSVTARVVPSNVFAVSSIQLIEPESGSTPIRDGDVIAADTTLPTLLFQSALNTARKVFRAIGREPTEENIGALTALGQATQGRGQAMTDSGHALYEIVEQLDSVVGDGQPESTLATFNAAVDGLRHSAPELVDVLNSAIRPMQTFTEKRVALTTFLSAGQNTIGELADAFENQTDRLVTISTQLTPVLGLLADQSENLHVMFTKIDRIANSFYTEAWNPVTKRFTIKAALSFTPTRNYVRADCPRYGDMAGASCETAPEVPTAPDLIPALEARGFKLPPGVPENRPNLAPPRGSVPPPTDQPDDAPPPTEPGTAPASDENPTAPTETIHQQSAVIGGTVGPVGSEEEKRQLSYIIGTQADSATQLLLGPLARGATVHVTPDYEASR